MIDLKLVFKPIFHICHVNPTLKSFQFKVKVEKQNILKHWWKWFDLDLCFFVIYLKVVLISFIEDGYWRNLNHFRTLRDCILPSLLENFPDTNNVYTDPRIAKLSCDTPGHLITHVCANFSKNLVFCHFVLAQVCVLLCNMSNLVTRN